MKPKIKTYTIITTTTTTSIDNEQILIRKAHSSLWLRRARKKLSQSAEAMTALIKRGPYSMALMICREHICQYSINLLNYHTCTSFKCLI